VNRKGRDCPTGKRVYGRLGALWALARIDYDGFRRRERRAYRCPLCKGWHLTGMEAK
jgi:hypothetical protein